MMTRSSFALAALMLLGSAAVAEPLDVSAAPAFRAKPTAPIAIEWELAASPVVSQPLALTLTITSDIAIVGARLTLAVDDPLVLIEPAAETALDTLLPGEPVTVVVRVLPLIAQTQYLRVAVAGEGNGSPQLRTLSVPIRFEHPLPDKDSPAVSQSPADGVQSLQAVETVF
jgi:hypothetical protein